MVTLRFDLVSPTASAALATKRGTITMCDPQRWLPSDLLHQRDHHKRYRQQYVRLVPGDGEQRGWKTQGKSIATTTSCLDPLEPSLQW